MIIQINTIYESNFTVSSVTIMVHIIQKIRITGTKNVTEIRVRNIKRKSSINVTAISKYDENLVEITCIPDPLNNSIYITAKYEKSVEWLSIPFIFIIFSPS